MIHDGYLILDLTHAGPWLAAYAGVAVLVAVGFVVQRIGWGEAPRDLYPAVRLLRVLASALVVGALWPLWAVIAAFGLVLAGSV